MAWGIWRLPESRVHLIGPLRGRRLLELGCGAARWSIELSRRGARPVGLDLSARQLARARELCRDAGRPVPLVRANAERLPFEARSFDVVFCDWGAMTFGDPRRTVPECARVLRPGGVLVFATASPFRVITHDPRRDLQGSTLRAPYFGMHRVEYGPTEPVEFHLPYGEWFTLLRASGFAVDRMIEPRPPPRGHSAYLEREDTMWGRNWPIELIWRAVKERTGAPLVAPVPRALRRPPPAGRPRRPGNGVSSSHGSRAGGARTRRRQRVRGRASTATA
jgi:SAM-dependent methyltransferase